MFCKDSVVGQKTVRRFYLNRDDVEYKCSECGVGSVWNNLPLTLQLDHIDGDNHNNLPSNLRLLCPNCHSQTKTFAGKNIVKERKYYYCIDCGIEISSGAPRCVSCSGIAQRKINRPTQDELLGLLKSHKGNFTNVSKIYGVSDNTIRKWCKKYGLPTHTFDYVQKQNKKKKSEVEQQKPCYMIDKTTDEILMEFPSRVAAGKYVNPESKNSDTHIGSACAGKRKSAYGYKWRDKNDTEVSDKTNNTA